MQKLLKLFFDMTDKHALVREHIVKKVLSEEKSSILKKHRITNILAKIRNIKKWFNAMEILISSDLQLLF